MTRYALFGDIQGHAGPYAHALEDLGVDVAAGVVPPHLVVIQVGDLIHKGPESDATVELADRLLRTSPDRYVQLIGNHEGHYLGGPQFWPEPIAASAAVMMADWFVEGLLKIATTVPAAGVDLLVCHGGLTAANWNRLGRPTEPRAVADQLNAEFRADPAFALRPGRMLYGETGPPGVAWTEPHDELYRPWIDEGTVPFGQVHGHASLIDWRTGRFYRGVARKLRNAIDVDRDARHTSIVIGGQPFHGIDTAYGSSAATPPPTPLVFSDGAAGS